MHTIAWLAALVEWASCLCLLLGIVNLVIDFRHTSAYKVLSAFIFHPVYDPLYSVLLDAPSGACLKSANLSPHVVVVCRMGSIIDSRVD